MGICPTKKKDDANLIDEDSDDRGIDDSYDLNYEVKKSVIVIYADPKGPNSIKALELLESIDSKPHIVDISRDSNPKKLLKALKKYTGDSLPPYIFITGKYFGGVVETEAGIKNHTVQKMINSWLDSRVRFG